ncbi:MAG TPA: hypothetical protein VMF58_00550 [Rhizomicrobium sp.]|nr:hypothetical protein [Rhizomicrobium sp.]
MTDQAPILKAEYIVKTVERLRARIGERFPESGLSDVAADLADTARATAARIEELSQPNYLLRALALLAIAVGLVAQVYFAEIIDWSRVLKNADPVGLTQGLDAIVNLLILAFGAIWFVLTLEQRLKRRRILARLYELRAFAHVVDMHQLTKDPTVVLSESKPTESSPERRMTEFELSRYLDYCAEMLALIAKLAALYGGRTRDRDVMLAVTEIEELTSDLGRKIWQKIMILSDLDEGHVAKNR